MRRLALIGAILLAGPAWAEESQSIWSVQGENDSISTLPQGSDKYYTSGLRLGWTSAPGKGPGFASDVAGYVWGDGVTRVSFDLGHQIYTPRNTERVNPNPRDRPVAGYLSGTFAIIQDQQASRSTLAMTVGLIGPSALGRQVQNGFHTLIHDRLNNGWGGQLPDELGVLFLAERVWRVKVAQFAGIETDVLPSLTAGVGTIRDYAQAGVIFRIGQGLESDFGVVRIRPGPTGGDAFAPVVGMPWYIFAGVNGQAVARDLFLDGSTFRQSPHVQHNWLLGEMQAGIAAMWQGVRLSYSHTWQTNSFKGQKGGLFNFGSLAMSVTF